MKVAPQHPDRVLHVPVRGHSLPAMNNQPYDKQQPGASRMPSSHPHSHAQAGRPAPGGYGSSTSSSVGYPAPTRDSGGDLEFSLLSELLLQDDFGNEPPIASAAMTQYHPQTQLLPSYPPHSHHTSPMASSSGSVMNVAPLPLPRSSSGTATDSSSNVTPTTPGNDLLTLFTTHTVENPQPHQEQAPYWQYKPHPEMQQTEDYSIHASSQYQSQPQPQPQAPAPAQSQSPALSQHHQYESPSSPHSSSSNPETTGPLDRKARRRQQVAISARRHRSRKKHELQDLRDEVLDLGEQLDELRTHHRAMRQHGAVAEWEERAMAERRKRRQSEKDSEQLRRAIFTQRRFLDSLKSVFSASPVFTADINLKQLLHTYTSLGTNPHSRRRDMEVLGAPEKLHLAIEILQKQTQDIRFRTPHVHTQVIETRDMFGVTIVSVHAVEGYDVLEYFRHMRYTMAEQSAIWPEFATSEGNRKMVQRLPNMLYGSETARYRSYGGDPNEEEIIVDARIISSWQVTESRAMLVWDYVDEDALFPLRSGTDVKRNMIGVCLVQRELCEDGKERVVCRTISTKLHTRMAMTEDHPHKPTLTKFATSLGRDSTRTCGNAALRMIRKSVGAALFER